MTTQRYYVCSGGREKGPFTLDQLRDAVAQTAISTSAAVRLDGEAETQPLADVLRGHPAEAREVVRPVRRGAPRAGRRADLDNVYAPPGDDEPAKVSFAGNLDQGNYWTGFAIGLFGGCLALALTRNAKPETRRGVVTGFGAGLALGIIIRVLDAGTGR